MLSWTSFANTTYGVEYRSTPGDTNWIALMPEITATNGTTTLTNNLETNLQRYYRIGLLP